MIIKRLKSYIQVSSTFFIRAGAVFEERDWGKTVNIEGFRDLDFFLTRKKVGKQYFYSFHDGISGLKIGKQNKNPKRVILEAKKILSREGYNKVEFIIGSKINNKYISPRYRFIVNPNNVIYYVANSKDKDKKSIFTPKYGVRLREE